MLVHLLFISLRFVISNEALNMKAKVTFEKLRSALPQPVFLAGPPYRARQGAGETNTNNSGLCLHVHLSV